MKRIKALLLVALLLVASTVGAAVFPSPCTATNPTNCSRGTWGQEVRDFLDDTFDLLTGRVVVIFPGIESIEKYGAATSASAAVNTTSIQAAIDAVSVAGGGTVFVPKGVFLVSGSIALKSNVNLSGVPGQSWLKVNSGAFDILASTAGLLENVTIDGLSFDGSVNYPANSQVYQFGGTFSLNRAIGVSRTLNTGQSTPDVKNLVIKNCRFYKLSADGIAIRGHNNSDIVIQDNYFDLGSYRGSPILVSPATGATTSQYTSRVRISGNRSDTSGPQIYYDASKEDYLSSSDGISVDRLLDSEIQGNLIHKAASIGIRVEDSQRVSVIENTVTEPGNEGITAYKNVYDSTISGNTVKSWGRTPIAYGIRNYGGTYVVAREFPKNPGALLPADPTASSWFEVWPYTTANINLATIIAYSSSDYYSGPSAGILPYRGSAAISVTNETERCVVVGNTTAPDLTQTSGKFNYASDYGFTPVHSVNDVTSNTGNDCYVGPNDWRGRVAPLYWPADHDRINARGPLGSGIFTGRTIGDATYIKSKRPAFLVRSTGQLDFAINTSVDVVFATEIVDQGSNFSANIFTAPMTGLYQLSVSLDLRNLDTAATLYEVNIVASNRSYPWYLDPGKFSADVTNYMATISVLADMDKNDTAKVTIQQTGGAAQTDIQGGSVFSGALID